MYSFSKSGKSRHMLVCKKTGNFTRADITVYTCHCGYYCKSSGGLQQHQELGKNCRDRTTSKSSSSMAISLESSPEAPQPPSQPAIPSTENLTCCGQTFKSKAALSSHRRSKKHTYQSSQSSSSQPSSSQPSSSHSSSSLTCSSQSSQSNLELQLSSDTSQASSGPSSSSTARYKVKKKNKTWPLVSNSS